MQPNSRIAGAAEARKAKELFPDVAKGLISPFNKRIRDMTRMHLARQAQAKGQRAVDLL